MNVRGGQGRVQGDCGEYGYIGRVRGSGHYTLALNKNKGLFSSLGNNVFDYGHKG